AKIYQPVPTLGTVGSMVSIHGDGYGANETIKIGFGTTASIVSVETTESGTFAVTFVVDTQVRGLTTITATGLNTNEVDIRAFTIVPEITLVTPTRATVGTVISLKGNGFVGNCPIRVDLGTTSGINNTSTDVTGYFSTTFTVNTQAFGTASIVANDSNGSEADGMFIYSEIINITPTRATVGSVISIAGTGYGAGEQIKVDFGWTKPIATITAMNTGYFETVFTVNIQPAGTTTVVITGVVSGETNQKAVVIYSHIVNVTPVSGIVGTMVSVAGDGYAASEAVRIDVGEIASRTTTISSGAGAFGTVFAIDVQPYGTTSVVAVGINSGEMAKDYFHIEPNITSINPALGIVTDSVTITGNGYGASELIRVDFGQTTTITNVQASRWGSWTAVWTVDKQPTGDKTITACGTLFNEKAYTHFVIISGLFISPEIGSVGTIVTANGSGYDSNEQVRIELGKVKTITSVSADALGLFTTTFTIDSQDYGTTSVSAVGLVSGQASTVKFFIMPEITGLTPTVGTVGTLVTIDCTGYGAGEEIRLDFGKTITCVSSNASIDGTFTLIFTVDTQTYGTKSIVVTGLATGNVLSRDYLIISEIVSVTPTIGSVGKLVTIVGSGYGDNEKVQIDLGQTANLAQPLTSSDGTFSVTFTVNVQAYGTKTITVEGIDTRYRLTKTYCIIPEIISVMPNTGTVGTNVVITCSGYGSGEQVRVDFGQTSSMVIGVASFDGTFTTSWTVDKQGYGTQSIVAQGVVSKAQAGNTFYITPKILEVTPTIGTVGSIVTVRCDGYGADEEVSLTLGKTVGIVMVRASNGGTFTTTFTIDSQRYGTQALIIEGVNSKHPMESSVYITPEVVSVLPDSGTVGTLVTVSGTGYGIGEVLRVGFGKTMTIVTGTASNDGTFTTVFTVDTQGYATKTITVEGVQTLHPATNTFFILPEIVGMTPTRGTVGTFVTVDCTGYGSGETVRVDLGKTAGIVLPVASLDGTFTTVFTIDTQAYATRTVTVEGVVTGDARKTTFYIIPEIVSIVPTKGSVGTFVTVIGSGYGDAETMMVDFGLTANIVSGVSSNDGSFTLMFTIDTQKYGTKTIVAEGLATQYPVARTFCVIPQIISVKPSIGTVGTMVTIACSGYAGLENVRVDFGQTTNMVIGVTDQSGTFTAMFMVDVQRYGTRSIIGTGLDSKAVAENTFYITPEIISVTPSMGTVGTFVTIRCSGYGSNEAVQIGFGKTDSITTGIGSIDGTFTVVFTIDAQKYATTTIRATGIIHQHTADNTCYILPEVISVVPTSGTIGTVVRVECSGYGASENVRVDFGKTVSMVIGQTTENGTFGVTFAVNTQPCGTTTIRATSVVSKDREGMPVTQINRFEIITATYITPINGTIGTYIVVNGDSYGADEDVRIDFGTTNGIVIAHTSSNGTFTAGFISNPQPYGTTSVLATGVVSGQVLTAKFFIASAIKGLTPTMGTVGTLVTIDCTGYGASEQVRLDFGKTITCVATNASIDGTFSIVFTVDTQVYGTKSVRVIGLATGQVLSKDYLIVSEIVSVTPTIGSVGKLVTVVGSGYGNNEKVQIDFGQKVNLAQPLTSSDGTFSVTFTVDVQRYGTKTIIAEGVDTRYRLTKTYCIIPEIISVVPNTGTVGTSVVITCSGYGSGEQVRVDFGKTSSMVIGVASFDGTFTT
ncbi:MAG: hypothetical protein AAB296_09120, partial [Candidatus Desantisbacteria bacterium]